MRWLFVAVIALTAAPAAAQTYVGGYPGLALPNLDSPDILCNVPTTTCRPLNIAACDDSAGLARTFKVALPAIPPNLWTNAGASAKVYVWLQKTTTSPSSTVMPICQYMTTTTSQNVLIATWQYATNVWPFTGAAAVFPDDYNSAGIASTPLNFSVGDVMNVTGVFAGSTVMNKACPTGASATYVLCFGIDTINNTSLAAGSDSQVDGTSNREVTLWVQFLIDTVPPAAVDSVSATALKARIEVSPKSAGKLAGDRWNVKIREQLGSTPSTAACNTWVSTDADPIKTATGDAISAGSVSIDATNGVTYEGCVDLLDQVGNEGTGSASFSATPFDQCDFASCYPGQLQTGFCAAVAPVPMAATVILLLLRRLRRRDGVRS